LSHKNAYLAKKPNPRVRDPPDISVSVSVEATDEDSVVRDLLPRGGQLGLGQQANERRAARRALLAFEWFAVSTVNRRERHP